MSKATRAQTDEKASGERQALEKFAANLFAQLEHKRAQENYEVSKLQMPIELGYYRAAYDGLVATFGQPYHKCTLELYQQLAGELGFVAEMFVMDKTPTITTTRVPVLASEEIYLPPRHSNHQKKRNNKTSTTRPGRRRDMAGS
uniref:Uncharacterized protein n=1 Tax=Anopheles culicifacies TaxID=139723 RepID=A0A182LX94_9DIPT